MSTGTFYPSLSYISGITNAAQAVVTFTAPHDFTVGEIIGLRSSRPYGMFEVNNLSVRVLATTSTTVTIELNTTSFTPFVYPPVGEVTYPAIAVPASSGVVPGAIPAQTNLIDAFENIPPNGVVP